MRIRKTKVGGIILTAVAVLVGVAGLMQLFGNPLEASAILAADPSTIPACAGNPECFAFTIDTRFDQYGSTWGTSREFSVPLSGRVSDIDNTYNWIVNWGDGTETTHSGTGSTTSAGISHTYPSAGQYRIAIRPAVAATMGWFNAFGFYSTTTGANADANKYKFRSIDTPFTNLMRTQGATYRFATMFYYAYNGTEIPSNLFANISTTGDTNFSYMFWNTFYSYAYDSTVGTIPAGLFDSLDTSNGTDFSSMFYNTFYRYASSSTVGTIPSGLFDSIDTSSGMDFSSMFYNTFYSYASSSTVGTIPSGLFASLDTSKGTSFNNMFLWTFYYYAYRSTVGTIPSGLFDSLGTSNGTDFNNMFRNTFNRYAYNSTVGTIPSGLFDSLDTSNGTDFSSMFRSTFYSYAYNSTVGTIPSGLFDSLDTSNGTDFSSMFYNTFYSYASSSTVGTIPSDLFASLDTSKGTSFNNMFLWTFYSYALNSTTATIPAGLFDSLDTSNGTSFIDMFGATFYGYASGSTTATIPAGLFGSLDTSNGTNFERMFGSTFVLYAYDSTVGTIPSGLFDSLDTSNGTNFNGMFQGTFSSYAFNSTTATIPAGLFGSLDTSNGTNFSYMFSSTFDRYASSSIVGTIPAGLFDSLDTSNGTNFSSMFGVTFFRYASSSTVGTIPQGLFESIDTSKGTSFNDMFSGTFYYYAGRQASFVVGGAQVATSDVFEVPYAVKIGPTGAPSTNPTVNATTGSQVIPTYSAASRSISAPTGAYAGYNWYRTDGSSCFVASPTVDCGAQTPATYVTFPNTAEWTQTTSTEKGNVTFYAGPASAAVANGTVTGWTSVDLTPKAMTITLAGARTTSIPAGTDVSSWFTNLPAGLVAKIVTAVAANSTSLSITISGVPTGTSSSAMSIVIPASVLNPSAEIAVVENENAKWDITTALAVVADVIVSGYQNVEIAKQTTNIILTNTAVEASIFIRAIPMGTDITNWFTNIPDGLVAIVGAAIEDGDVIIPVMFTGTPTVLSNEIITLTIPGTMLTFGGDLEASSNPYARWNIAEEPIIPPGTGVAGKSDDTAVMAYGATGVFVAVGVLVIARRRIARKQ